MIVASPYDGTTPSIHPTAFIAKDAVIIGDVEIGAYVNIWFGAKLRGDWGKIVVGENTSIQENCVIHTTVKGLCKIGKNVTLGHLSMVHGPATIGNSTLIGIGASVLWGGVCPKFLRQAREVRDDMDQSKENRGEEEELTI